MKLIRVLVVLCLFFTSNGLFSQTWDGNNTTTGIGSVGTSSSSLYKFRVYNSGSTSPYALRIDNYYSGSSAKYGIYSYLSSAGTGTRYGIYSYAQDRNDYSIYSARGAVGVADGLEIINTGISNRFVIHAGWQTGDYSFYITPRDGSGTELFSRSLYFHRDGYLEKKIDNAASTALAVSLNGTRNFQVMGSGKVFAREVEVTLNAFPDYVFEKDYDLLSLKELQQYIDENQHLPNIPSAQEVEENGIGLGELSLKQLEKIEELTLYILELNKRIENLEKQLSEARKGKPEN